MHSGCASPTSIDGVFFTMLCLEGVVFHTFETYMVPLPGCWGYNAFNDCEKGDVVNPVENYLVRSFWFHVALTLGFALLLHAHLVWLVAWLSCLPCRNWCNIIIIIVSLCLASLCLQLALLVFAQLAWLMTWLS
jgi:hypothetical protein